MARIPEAEIERLKEAVPVERMVEASGIELMSRVGVIRPRGVGIFRPVGGVPKSVSKHFFEGAILQC